MKRKDRIKLIDEMFPEALKDTVFDRGIKPCLAEIATAVCDNLPAGEEDEFAATVVITSLQLELGQAKLVIQKLRKDVDFALAIIAENCDCGECDPCSKQPLLERHLTESAIQIARYNLSKP